MAGIKKRLDIFINGKQAGETIGNLQKQSRQLNNEIKQLVPGTEAYNKKVKELQSVNGQLNEHRRTIKGIGGAFGSIRESMGNFTKMFLGPLGLVGLMSGVVSGIKGWVTKNKELEKSLSSLQSLTGASNEDMKTYKAEAIAIGKETTLSANQIVDGFKLVGSARPELLKNKDALIDVTKEAVALAEASEQELGPSTQALVGIMNQFGLENDEASRTINVLAAGSKEGAAGIQDLSDATDKAGAVAAGFNVSLEAEVGLLETLAEKNIKGAEAGTKLRNFLLTMQTVEALPPEALNQLEQYGVDIKKVSDDSLPFQERLTEMAKIADDATALTKVFGKENVVVGSVLLNNVDAVDKYTQAVTGTNTAYEQQRTNTDNLDGDMKSLASAWEGFNLILDGSNALLRPFIQGITSIINGVTNVIQVFKEWDELGIENLWLGIKKAFVGANSALGRFYDHQIRVNDISREVIDEIQTEAREVDVLTTAIAQNNMMLEQANITEENAAELHAQNEEIVAELRDRYPELTSEIDFQTASYEELSVLQKEITANLIQQAIETAKVAEQERILNEIVGQSMALSEARSKKGESAIWDKAITELENEMEFSKLELQNLENTFTEVEANINDLDLNFGEDFDANTKIVIHAQKELAKFLEQLANATSETEKQIIQAQIDNGKKLLEKSGALRQDQIDAILNGASEVEQEITDITTEEVNERGKALDKGAKKRQKDLENTLKELEKIQEAIAKYKEEAANEALIDSKDSEFEKELVKLQINLDKKFEKEISAAENLAQKEGEIGQRAQEQLAVLKLLKTEEFEKQKLLIEEKYIEISKQKALESTQELARLEIQAIDASSQLKLAKAAMALEEYNGYSISKRKELLENYRIAEEEHQNTQKTIQLSALNDQYTNGLISLEEYHDRKEQLEIEHQAKIKAFRDKAQQEQIQRANDTVQNIGGMVMQGIEVINQFREINLQKNVNFNNQLKEESLQQLQDEFDQGLISQQDYLVKKDNINRSFDEKEKRLKEDAARKAKAAAIITAGINGALAVMSAIAQFGPPPSPLGIAGIALAGATTIAQIAAINAQPAAQFFDGGYSVKGAKDGKTYNANYLGSHNGGMLPSSPSLLLASERGPEYFVPNHMLRDPEVANHVRIIEAIRTNQYFDGGFSVNKQNQPIESQASQATSNSEMVQAQTLSVLNDLAQILPNIKVKIGDKQVDEITEAQQDLAELKG